MEKNNELIADFMGMKYYPPVKWWDFYPKLSNAYSYNGKWGYSEKGLKFHTSWDWLMPVVEKIEGLGYLAYMMPYQSQIFKASGNFAETMIIDADFRDNRLDNTYDAVIGFIEWHNSQKL